MSKPKLFLDVDEVICFPHYLKYLNKFLNTNYTIDDFTNYYIDEEAIPKEQMEEFNNYLKDKNLYEDPNILPDALECLKKLNEITDIYIYSDCLNPFDIANSSKIFVDKFNFLLTYLPFINPEKFIFTASKDILKGDIIVDDRLKNLQGDFKLKILFPSYHNQKDSVDSTITKINCHWQNAWQEVTKVITNYLKEN